MPYKVADPSRQGLTTSEVNRSRKNNGSNELTQKKRRGFFRQFLSAFGDPIIKVLLIALAINVIFLFRDFDWYETAGIAIAIFLATFVSTLSEYGSESAFKRLQEEAVRIKCRVRRNGKTEEIPVADVVVGDLILLSAGERIPADGKLIFGEIGVDQSALNGESKEAKKKAVTVHDHEENLHTTDFLHPNYLFRGGVVCSGEGEMLVYGVGDGTFYGQLAGEVQGETRESPLKLRLSGLAKTLSRLGYLAAVLVAGADLFFSFVIQKGPNNVFEQILHAVTLAITVVVVAVPEGLPMMITVVLSSNMRRMLKDHVLVRKLVGIETSGSINILFTDKTGTLTKGQLEVSRFITGEGTEIKTVNDLKRRSQLYELVAQSCFFNTGSEAVKGFPVGGNATDRALLSYIMPIKSDLENKFKVKAKTPFNSTQKFSTASIVGLNKGAETLHFVKGAPERILSACNRFYDERGNVKPLISHVILDGKMKEMTKKAARVLALAVSESPIHDCGGFNRLILVGLVAIRDEIRPEAPAAVARIQEAGIQTVLVTGDNKETAAAIAKEAGLLQGAGNGAIITSEELNRLRDSEVKKIIPSLRVVARALPSDKSRLVQLAQELGLVTGMTGDGINDAPALKKADVGFAMGSGTEVAKEAGDIVILDDNIASIAKAVLYGRTIFKSIRKFIIFQLTMNLCAVGISIVGPFIGIDTPVTVIQMLWINIIMDTLAGLAFAGEPPLGEYMREKPKRRDEPIINKYMANQIICMGLFTVTLSVVFLKLPYVKTLFRYSSDPIFFMAAFFALFIFAGVFNCFNARTTRVNLFSNLRKNPAFFIIMSLVAIVQVILIYFGGSLFRTAPLIYSELRSVMLIALLVIPADIVRKLVMRFKGRKGIL